LDVDKGITQKIMRVNQRKILHKKIAVKANAFWKIPILTNCRFRIVRKKKKYHIPDAASERV